MTILSREFWDYSLERAAKTFAQTALAALGTGTIGLLDIDWVVVGSLSGGAALLSVLTSIVTHSK
jgi:hypothetical protein